MSRTILLRSKVHSVGLESLERRVFLCADHPIGEGTAPLTQEMRDYLNALPPDSPMPFDFAEQGDGRDDGDGRMGGFDGETNVTTILDSGPTSNRIDIVLVGDGYTTSDLPTYEAHADNVLSGFFAQQPLDIYRNFFNVHRVDVVSNQSGVDNDPTQGINRDTALDMQYWCNGIERLLCVNVSKARNFANLAPGRDQTLAIANSSKYGGAGYPSSDLGTLAGGNSLALEIALHEFGHSFADLADEYDYGGPVVYNGSEPSATNVSIYTAQQMAQQQRKWYRWLDHPAVDTFEGANYSEQGIYRPTVNSKMRELNRPFDPVNVEQLILSAYRTVNPIDSATTAGSYPSTADFAVDPVDPIGNPLAVQWFLDGQAIAGATDVTFDGESLGALNGTHSLSVRVVDTTALVRDESLRASLMTEQRSWTLLDVSAPQVTSAEFEVDAPAMQLIYTFSEALATAPTAEDFDIVNLTTGQTIPNAATDVFYDAATRAALVTFHGFAAGVLPDGNYTATLAAGGVSDVAGNALADDATLDYFFVQADATRDRSVNLGDFNVLRAHFGQSGRVFSQGDFNYDGAVNLADFNILRANFGAFLPPEGGNLFDGGDDDGDAADDLV